MQLTDFRKKFPQYKDLDDDALTESLHSKHYSDIPREKFNEQIGYKPPAPDKGVFTTAKESLYRGGHQLKAIGGGLASLAGEASGLDDLADWGIEVYTSSMEDAKDYKAEVGTFRNIENLGDAGTYAIEAIFENLPMFLPSLITGGVGAFAAKQGAQILVKKLVADQIAKGATRQVAEKAALKAVQKRVAIGAAAGAYPSGFGLEAGSIYGEIYDETGERRPGIAAVGGAVAGAFEALPNVALIRRALGPVGDKVIKRYIGRVGIAAAEQTLLEAPTEAIQTIIEKVSLKAAAPETEVFSAQSIDEIIDATLKGGIAGGAIGGGVSSVTSARRGNQAPAEPVQPGAQVDPATLTAETAAVQPVPPPIDETGEAPPDMGVSRETRTPPSAADTFAINQNQLWKVENDQRRQHNLDMDSRQAAYDAQGETDPAKIGAYWDQRNSLLAEEASRAGAFTRDREVDSARQRAVEAGSAAPAPPQAAAEGALEGEAAPTPIETPEAAPEPAPVAPEDIEAPPDMGVARPKTEAGAVQQEIDATKERLARHQARQDEQDRQLAEIEAGVETLEAPTTEAAPEIAEAIAPAVAPVDEPAAPESEADIKVEEVSVNDTYQGEMFGTKVLRVDGIGQAIADINILEDEVSIRNIETGSDVRGKGYAKRLVDDLFNEFPDKKIVITNTTEDGAGFFEKNYDLDEDQRIYPKGTKPVTAQDDRCRLTKANRALRRPAILHREGRGDGGALSEDRGRAGRSRRWVRVTGEGAGRSGRRS